MPGFCRRPLALFVCYLFAGTAEASDAGPAPRLKLEYAFNLLAGPGKNAAPPKPEKDKLPAFVAADHLEGRVDEIMVAEGQAEYRSFGKLLLADKLTYRAFDDEVEAAGNVHFLQGEDEISGPAMRLKLTEQIGFFDQADYHFKKEVLSRFYQSIPATTTVVSTTTATSGAPLMINIPQDHDLSLTANTLRPVENYGHAERVNFEGENKYRLINATYSTCKPEKTDWYARAEEFELDYDQGTGTAKNALVYFKDFPIFYTPAGWFSLNRNRKSGFLAGTFAASSKNGFDLSVPYYWNIAPNYDATLYPRYMSKRGFQLGVDARYLGHYYSGTSNVEYLPSDEIEKRSRYAYNFVHSHTLGRGFSMALDWNGVSDDRYWEDFSSRLLQTSQSQLPRQWSLYYNPGSWWSASATWLHYQTLQPNPAAPVGKPYFLEPQIGFSGRILNVADHGDFGVTAQYTRFTHPSLVEGSRTVVYPSFSLPYVDPGYSLTPRAGLHASHYALSGPGGYSENISRVLPVFSLDAQVNLERAFTWQGRDYLQTLEPRLFYVYIPHKNQDRIPVFDTGLSDFNFGQIFNENRYVGHDRINDANQLTAAVTTRFLDASTGVERFKAMAGQRYYFEPQRVTLPGETVRTPKSSNFLAAFNGNVLPHTYVDAAWQYNNRKRQSDQLSVGMRYQPELAKVISASYRLNRDPLSGTGQVDQIDIAAQWPLSKRLYAVGRYNYSLRDKQLLEAIGGVEYNAGCWAARFVVQRLEALSGSPNTTVFFQLELNDFASIGSNPIQLLRRTIPGYGKTNEMPAAGSLLTTESTP